MKLIDISTPKYPNTFTMVDDEDYEFLNQWRWTLNKPNGYVRRKGPRIAGKHKSIFMHLEILKPPPGMKGDHRFGNKLDNRRANLRICTQAENNRNRRPNKGSPFKGVRKIGARYVARIHINGEHKYLGRFDTAETAAAAWNSAAKEIQSPFTRFNTL